MIRTEIATLPDGATLRYRRTASDSACRLALIHPLAMDLTFWDRVVDWLPGGIDVLAYDVRGHGRSTRLSSAWSARQHGGDLFALMDIVDWCDAVVAGASMGGCIAIAAAEGGASRVRGLGLIDTTAWYGPDAPENWRNRAERALNDGMESLVEFQLARWFSDAFRAADGPVIRDATAVFLANSPASYAEACAMLGAFDGRADLERFRGPCRIVVGREDYATPLQSSVEMVELARDGMLDVVEGARHFTPLERPEVVALHLGRLVQAAYATDPASAA